MIPLWDLLTKELSANSKDQKDMTEIKPYNNSTKGKRLEVKFKIKGIKKYTFVYFLILKKENKNYYDTFVSSRNFIYFIQNIRRRLYGKI